ncbi:MAG: PTS sugar transporter subunit IIC [Lachnospiraceae bacterium]|nr:PTS sugar transporter subunit IIC [Lachnospiraceae bacterium]
MKKLLKEIFIDGLSGMANGLFATLIMGTILVQIAGFVPGTAGAYMLIIGKIAQGLTGAGIGVGTAMRLEKAAKPLVIVSAAVSGMVGAFASKILAGSVLVTGAVDTGLNLNNALVFIGPGEPLGAFFAVLVTIYTGRLVAGRTKIDILVTPFCCILSGAIVGIIIGPPISQFMTWIGSLVNWGTEQAPFVMGIVVSVLMGIILTLPISSAAIGVILGLSGLAAGAATVGCAANMVGFAVASFVDNGVNGLIAQGIGTSMIQIGNIVKKPVIWLPAIITSAILGPVSTCVLHMTNNATGSGMGTSGLVGQINAYTDMTANGVPAGVVLAEIIVMHFILPAILSGVIAFLMRKRGIINKGDMLLSV